MYTTGKKCKFSRPLWWYYGLFHTCNSFARSFNRIEVNCSHVRLGGLLASSCVQLGHLLGEFNQSNHLTVLGWKMPHENIWFIVILGHGWPYQLICTAAQVHLKLSSVRASRCALHVRVEELWLVNSKLDNDILLKDSIKNMVTVWLTQQLTIVNIASITIFSHEKSSP
jgi:hypothetical protein